MDGNGGLTKARYGKRWLSFVENWPVFGCTIIRVYINIIAARRKKKRTIYWRVNGFLYWTVSGKFIILLS